MRVNKNILWGAATVIVLIIALVYTLNNNKKHVVEILESPLLTTGTLTEIRYEKGKTILGDFYFEVEGMQFKSTKGDGRLQQIAGRILNRNFPVIYNSKNPSKNDLLIFPSDFEKYGISFPDSLNWIEKLVNK